MIIYKEVPIPIYNDILYIVDSDNWDEVNAFFNTPYTADENNEMFAHAIKGWFFTKKPKPHKKQVLLMVFNSRNSIYKVETGAICHEAIHIKNFLFEDKGIRHDLVNDEPEAYLVGWIVEQAVQFFIENRANSKKTKTASKIAA